MKALIVGAGAVGQVFGYHLRCAGEEVTFLVRSQYAEEARRGFELVALGRGALKPTALREFTVVSSARDLAVLRFDQVYLTVPSTGLLGPWLAELIEATGEATIVAFPTGTEDVALLRASGLRDERTVHGLLSLVSYAAPLAGETRFSRQSTAYWFPPLSPGHFGRGNHWLTTSRKR